jgi:hypothetical protein
MQDFRVTSLIKEFAKFGLGGHKNAQHIIVQTVLESKGPCNARQYKWKLSEAPSKKLVDELNTKVKEYSARCTINSKTNKINPLEKNKNLKTRNAHIVSIVTSAKQTVIPDKLKSTENSELARVELHLSNLIQQKNAALETIKIIDQKIKACEDLISLEQNLEQRRAELKKTIDI